MPTEEEEEEDEDAFHDDLPDIEPQQQRYLIQKYATLWFNKIRPGELEWGETVVIYISL